jgi:hypothetical protein
MNTHPGLTGAVHANDVVNVRDLAHRPPSRTYAKNNHGRRHENDGDCPLVMGCHSVRPWLGLMDFAEGLYTEPIAAGAAFMQLA